MIGHGLLTPWPVLCPSCLQVPEEPPAPQGPLVPIVPVNVPRREVSGPAYNSILWGKAGERWTQGGRLTDHSYSGYMANERAIPNYPVHFNVKSFGAVGDGVADDTAAFKKAVAAAAAKSLSTIYTASGCARAALLAALPGLCFAGMTRLAATHR